MLSLNRMQILSGGGAARNMGRPSAPRKHGPPLDPSLRRGQLERLMPPSDARFWFDFVDPLSWIVERALRDLEAPGGARVVRSPRELRPPPDPLTRSSDPFWVERREEAARAAPQATLAPPALVPWTRKAHELHAFAAARDAGPVVRRGIFEAFFEQGRDIGRVDVLVRIATAAGLDATEAKAALDVDKHAEDVLAARREADAAGVGEVPALLVQGRLVQGFRNLADLSTLLRGPPPGGR
jgi:predicted DsbA family dithiol-disulfide isomerase